MDMRPVQKRSYPPDRWTAMTGMCIAAGLVWLAFADFAVTVPTISRELAVSLPQLQWANNAFSLTAGALVLAAGRQGDVFGHKKMLETGLVGFGVLSLIAVVTPGMTGLIIGRALMGVAAALILPATLALIPAMFPVAEHARAFGAWMVVAWVGQGMGPAVGGVLTSALGWRSTFWINAPLALAALYLVRRSAIESIDPNASRHLDMGGLTTSALAAFCLLYGLTEGQERGFGDPLVLVLLAASIVLAGGFVWLEKRLSDPLLDMHLFSSRPFCGALVANTVLNAVFAGLSFLLSLYLQEVRGYSALTAGLLLLPSTVTILLCTPIGGRIAAKHAARLPVVAGLLLTGVGTLLTGTLLHAYSYALIALGLLILGTGLGLMSIPLSDTAVAGPPMEVAGMASGMFKVTSMLGGAFGVAALAAVRHTVESQAVHHAQATGLSKSESDILRDAVSDSRLLSQVESSLDQATRAAVTEAYHRVETVGCGVAILVAGATAVVASATLPLLWRLPGKPQPHRDGEESGEVTRHQDSNGRQET
ncbi:MFS transporter [Streptomyces sp. 1222.5]|uniref:MFS transporter n=1 Tax=Streptomyces sp. 1222.5 TaxID=1881026 RepID=UPI003EBE926D